MLQQCPLLALLQLPLPPLIEHHVREVFFVYLRYKSGPAIAAQKEIALPLQRALSRAPSLYDQYRRPVAAVNRHRACVASSRWRPESALPRSRPLSMRIIADRRRQSALGGN